MNWAIIMAGGKGARFWPESRAGYPKPFLPIHGRRTLLEETVQRLKPFFPSARILIVLQENLISRAKKLLRGIPSKNFLGEPVGRNTAPCAAYAATRIAAKDPNARIVFLPADHYIQPKSLFQKTLKRALRLADEKPVLFGIRPKWPNPAYGYLEVRKNKVVRFHEKPSPEKARQFLKRKKFFWNSGIFVWRLDAFAKALKKYLPRIDSAFRPPPSAKALKRAYRKLPSISLDYGMMEKLKNCHCLVAPFTWSDLGGWKALAEFWPSDSKKNRAQGKTLLLGSERNIVKATSRLVVLLGVQDLVVVETADALLVCHQKEAEGIRHVVEELEKRKASAYL